MSLPTNPIVTHILNLRSAHEGQMLVGLTPLETERIQEALTAGSYTDRDAEVFSNRDPAVLRHIIRKLEQGYCVAVIPTGINQCAVFSGSTLKFPRNQSFTRSTTRYQPPINSYERARVAEFSPARPDEAVPPERSVEPDSVNFGPNNGWLVIIMIIALIAGISILAD